MRNKMNEEKRWRGVNFTSGKDGGVGGVGLSNDV